MDEQLARYNRAMDVYNKNELAEIGYIDFDIFLETVYLDDRFTMDSLRTILRVWEEMKGVK